MAEERDLPVFKSAILKSIEKLSKLVEISSTDPVVSSHALFGRLNHELKKCSAYRPKEWQMVDDISVMDLGAHSSSGLSTLQSLMPQISDYEQFVADIFDSEFDTPATSWISSALMSKLEDLGTDWVGWALGIPSSFHHVNSNGGGTLHYSNLGGLITAMTAARDRYIKHMVGSNAGTHGSNAYASATSTMSSRMVVIGESPLRELTEQAAKALGVLFHNFNPGNPSAGQDCFELIQRLRSGNLHPFFVNVVIDPGSASSSGSAASLVNIKSVVPAVWIHADYQLVGPVTMDPGIANLSGQNQLSLVNSLSMDLDKGAFAGFGMSCFFTTDKSAIESSMSLTPSGISDSWLNPLANWQLSYGKPFRGLKLFVIWSLLGPDAIKAKLMIEMGAKNELLEALSV